MRKSLYVCQGNSVAGGLKFTNWILNSESSFAQSGPRSNSEKVKQEGAFAVPADSPFEVASGVPCEVVESSILPGGGFLIIVQGDAALLQKLHEAARAESMNLSIHCLLIENAHAQVLPAFYSLQNEIPPDTSLLICECNNVLDAFVTANEAAKFDSAISILDIRNGRGTSGIPLVILGGPASALKSWDTEMSTRGMGELDQRAFLETPHPKFMELFV